MVEVYEGEFEPRLKELEDGPRTGNEPGLKGFEDGPRTGNEPGLKGLEDGSRTGNERGWGSTLLTTRIGGLAKIIVFPSQLLVFKVDRDKLDGPDGINEKALP